MDLETGLLLGGTVVAGLIAYNLTKDGAAGLGEGIGTAVEIGATGVERAGEEGISFVTTTLTGLKVRVSDKDTLPLGAACRQTIECSSTGKAGGISSGPGRQVGCCNGRCNLRRQNYKGKWKCRGDCKACATCRQGTRAKNVCRPSTEEMTRVKTLAGASTLQLGSPCRGNSDCSRTGLQGGRGAGGSGPIGCVRSKCGWRRKNFDGTWVDAMACKRNRYANESRIATNPCDPTASELMATGGLLLREYADDSPGRDASAIRFIAAFTARPETDRGASTLNVT